MKFLKSHFALTRSQQNGIFVLVILIIVFQVILMFDFFPENRPDPSVEAQVEMYRRQLDSLNSSQREIVKKDTIYPFNPNFLTDFKGYQVGMNIQEIDRLLAHRNAGKWINSPEDFQKVTGVSDSLLKVIKPSLRFPAWTQKSASARPKTGNFSTSPTSPAVTITDLNSATAEDLRTVNGVGEVLSARIVKYRLSIGGFVDPIQLQDVYGLSPEVIQKILLKFQILSRPDIEIRNINTITATQLAELPYFNYELAQKLISYRKLHEGIRSFEELSKIDGFPSDKIGRIKLYLAIQ